MNKETEWPAAEHMDREATGKHLELYLRRLFRIVTRDGNMQDAALLMVDAQGRQKLLLGAEERREYLALRRFVHDTVWNEETAGRSAVVRGLAGKCSCVSEGTENGECLKDMAIYFHPLLLTPEQDPDAAICCGGIAVIVPQEEASPNYRILAAFIAHDLVMNLHFRRTSDRLFERSGGGVISVDVRMRDGEIMITSCNEALFRILDVPGSPADFIGRPLSTLLDDARVNHRFLEIASGTDRVEDSRMTISVRGNRIHCIVSADHYFQAALQVRATTFFITTDRQISGNIARRTMNTALLTFDDIVGQSTALRASLHRARQIAGAESNVLLIGESGVGKDVFAQAIHNGSRRSSGPFVAVNCAALPRELIASELFGYDEGAFTGAKRGGNIGKFELAEGGTIFLDEIGDLPLELQGMLLRIVEQKQFSRLGSSRSVKVDTRIISATNADLLKLVREKKFREDLYYRLSTMMVTLPPLREREDDVVLLAEYFLRRICERTGREEMTLSEAAADLLRSLSFPGNIRQLQNAMESIALLYPGDRVMPDHILNTIPEAEHRSEDLYRDTRYGNAAHVRGTADTYTGRMPVRHMKLDAEQIRDAIERCGNNKTAAARLLGVSIRTLYRRMEQLGMKDSF